MLQSKLYKDADIAWQRDSWLRLHRPMTTRELNAVQGDWIAVLGDLSYIRVVKATQNYGSDHLLTIRCKAKLPIGHMEIAQADIGKLWMKELSDGMECGHTFRRVPGGFELQFIGLNQFNTVLSGQIIVEMM